MAQIQGAGKTLLETGSRHSSKPASLKEPKDVELVDPQQEEAEATDRAQKVMLRFWIVFMVLTGGAVDYFADFFNTVVPDEGLGNEAAVFLTTALSFLACAVPPTISSEDRGSLRSVNAANSRFKYKVLVPALADLIITGMRYWAILYVSPAVVSILKTSSQLLLLSLYKHFKGKKLTWRQASCLLVAFVGEVAVCVASRVGHTPGSSSSTSMEVFGLILAVSSGILGAVRNVVEEALLQGDDLSAGGLLMAESWISFVGVVATTLIWRSSQGVLGEFLRKVGDVCTMAPVWPLLVAIMGCTYSKDFGKLLVTKRGDALLAKVLCMLFPIVTWILSLVTFASTAGSFGEGLDVVSSSIRFAGFFLVAAACISFVVLQKKKI